MNPFSRAQETCKAYLRLGKADAKALDGDAFVIVGTDPQNLVERVLTWRKKRDRINAKPWWFCEPIPFGGGMRIICELELFGSTLRGNHVIPDEMFHQPPQEQLEWLESVVGYLRRQVAFALLDFIEQGPTS